MEQERSRHPIDAILLDFDGVLVDSVPLKSRAFREVVALRWPECADAADDYFMRHGGVSRMKKFEHVVRNIAMAPATTTLVEELCQEFAQRVYQLTVECPEKAGARAFLEQYYREIPLFVISGTPQGELRRIVGERGQSHFFREVFGSPDDKVAIGRRIIDDYHFDPNRICFVGDATTDRDAATELGIPFIGVDGPHLTPFLNGSEQTIRDLSELPGCLELTKG